MKTLLVAALFLSLVASIYSQVPDAPTADQLQCITDASTAQALDLATDCAGTNIDDLSSICNSGACFTRLSVIYDGCGYNGISVACGDPGTEMAATPATDDPQIPDPPTADQLQCITDASTAQALDILNDCSSADLSDLSSICNSGACFNRILGIYNGCGYNGLSAVCSDPGTDMPATTDDGFPDNIVTPNPTQLQCITDASNAQLADILTDCADVDLEDVNDICNSRACFNRISDINNRCGYNGLDVFCSDPTDMPATTNDGFPDNIVTPNPEQLQCITDASNAQLADILTDCGDVDLEDVSDICNSGACFNRISGINNRCGYNGLNVFCGGAEKLIALPVLTLVAVALSILF